ncbi:SOS response-associated peptidase [Mesorhizobium sp. B2-4-9]|uniref:SOS response-associated peptidase family protein n=1 Tax=Mesorhizobium sp. B2-4-9 TaxID=2589940 RepID=UPI001129692C|nr:SOS response-associated peptidase family protein [Mesorhizobium sp. B2-4-9]TPL21090.1 SOS response-associated peptidase [Mesorhizobium sp. B2-4-9]
MKDLPKAAIFNARIEGIDTALAYRDAFKSKRCLIPADGFFEYTISPADGKKDPWHTLCPATRHFRCRSVSLQSNFEITSCIIITERVVEPIKNLHDRQALILDRAYYDAWLEPGAPTDSLQKSSGTTSTASCSRVGWNVNSTVLVGPNNAP